MKIRAAASAVKKMQYRQSWVRRLQVDEKDKKIKILPYQKIDQIVIEEYKKRRLGLFSGNGVSKSETFLADKLRAMGLEVIQQYAIPDMDNGNIFNWFFDLYLPELDLLIEVQGSSHNKDKYQKEQDKRKRELAILQGFKFKTITNDNLSFNSEIDKLLK
jgi:very-short-patch-repair endonuclease